MRRDAVTGNLRGAVTALCVAVWLVAAPAQARPTRRAPAGIAEAARKAAVASPIQGDAAGTAALLLAIADHESAFRGSIIRCQVKGDNGRAHGAYQLHSEAFGDHTAHEVCNNDELQARLALAVLHRYLVMFPEHGVRGAIQGFASGHAARQTRASKEIWDMWQARRAMIDRKATKQRGKR
jgi:hypothetical protein